MKSKLSSTDFRNKLQQNTKLGNPNIKGTPFAGYVTSDGLNKVFFGQFSETEFKLTKNSSLLPIPYVVEGVYDSTDKNETNITYEIKPIWFGYLWIRVFPAILLLVLNYLFITEKHFDIQVYLGLSLMVGILFLPILIINLIKTNFLKSFITIFEIED